jgi:hypothetical protein
MIDVEHKFEETSDKMTGRQGCWKAQRSSKARAPRRLRLKWRVLPKSIEKSDLVHGYVVH